MKKVTNKWPLVAKSTAFVALSFLAIYVLQHSISTSVVTFASTKPSSAVGELIANKPWLLRIMSTGDQIVVLNRAIEQNDRALMHRLIDLGVPLNSGECHFQPLFEAAITGNEQLAADLISRGALVNPDVENLRIVGTPLWGAAIGNHASMIEFLAQKGADPNLHAKDTMSALAIARQHNRKAAIAVLEKLKAVDRRPSSQ